jgi:hypothetical protein
VGMTKLFFNMRVWHNGTNYYIIILSLKILWLIIYDKYFMVIL